MKGILGEIQLTVWTNGEVSVTRDGGNEGESATYESPFAAIKAVTEGLGRLLPDGGEGG